MSCEVPFSASELVCDALLDALVTLGVRQAFGVSGGAIARLVDALGRSPLEVVHCRHETGAVFAAMEAYFATGSPTVVFTTTGPGLSNALTGLLAARWEGAKVVLLSATTPAPARGRWACQETSARTTPAELYSAGRVFDDATAVEDAAELPSLLARLSAGLRRPNGYVAHIALPSTLQGAHFPTARVGRQEAALPGVDEQTLERCARLVEAPGTVLWVGHGARGAAAELRALAERLGAPVMATPRAKGIFPERHPLYLGVTGLGGHDSVEAHLRAHPPARTLVLGTRLGEPSSYWDPQLLPTELLLHVDLDPTVPGAAYPEAQTLAIQAEIGAFLRGLLRHVRERPWDRGATLGPEVQPQWISRPGPVRALALMQAVQRQVVDASDAVVMTESGNAFAWGNAVLRFDTPRYRVSVGWGSMGHMCAGVLGAALGRRGKAVAIVGDGAMLMQNELSTAVQARADAVWIVMNDAQYGMVEHGMRALGLSPVETTLPRCDFAMMARAMGADGLVVEDESALDAALAAAMAARGPFVVDVRTDPTEAGPWARRIRNLIAQGAGGSRS